MIRQILATKYPHSTSETYSLMLSRIRQNSFHDTEDYRAALDQVLERWAVATSPTESELCAKREAAFLNGLSCETLDFMDLNGITRSEDILSRIRITESRIKQRKRLLARDLRTQVCVSAATVTGTTTKFSPISVNYQSRVSTRNSNASPQQPNHRCDFHKMNTHNTSECRTRQLGKNSGTTDQQARNLQETFSAVSSLELPVKVGDTEKMALLDTGSSNNYCSASLARLCGSPLVDAEPTNVRLADGSCVETTKKVTLSLKPTQSTQNSLPVDFFVLDSCESEIILDMKFLVERDFSCTCVTQSTSQFRLPKRI